MQTQSPSKVELVYRILEEKISSGEWPIGFGLPTEYALATEFDCGRNTITKAVTRLVHEGLVERKKRAGTRVVNNTTSRGAAPVELDAFAFIYPSRQHEGVRQVVRGFQDAAEEVGRRVLMLSTGQDYMREAEFVGRLTEFDVKGAVVYPVFSRPEDIVAFSRMMVASKFPIVLTEVDLPGMGRPAILVDGFHAGYTMTNYLIEKGAKRIGFFANYSWTTTARDKYKGYRRALAEAGLPEDPKAVMQDPAMSPNFANPLAQPTELARKYLDRSGRVDAVVCTDDFLAMGMIAAAGERGLSAPSDFLVAGLNECLGVTNITTYRAPLLEIGRMAFDVLSQACMDGEAPELERQLRGSLVVRETA